MSGGKATPTLSIPTTGIAHTAINQTPNNKKWLADNRRSKPRRRPKPKLKQQRKLEASSTPERTLSSTHAMFARLQLNPPLSSRLTTKLSIQVLPFQPKFNKPKPLVQM